MQNVKKFDYIFFYKDFFQMKIDDHIFLWLQLLRFCYRFNVFSIWDNKI